MKSKHLMIDLETLDTQPTAAIHEIGWAIFDPYGKPSQKMPSGSIMVDLQSCLDLGMTMSADTFRWWLTQEDAARQKMALPGIDILEALEQLNALMIDQPFEGYWSHGAAFDLPILTHAFHLVGMTPAWRFWDFRDTRTVFWLEKPLTSANKNKHDAEQDALHQARAVIDSLSRINRA